MKKNLGQQILNLFQSGKSYNQISAILNCSKGTVAYHCGKNQKTKAKLRCSNFRQKHPIIIKLNNFLNEKPTILTRKTLPNKIERIIYKRIHTFQKGQKMTITVQEVMDKLGDTPKCYLTGKNININEPKTYHFDHIIPISKGGQNTIENLGVCTKEANLAKSAMTHEEFLDLCKSVLLHHGYQFK